MHVGAGGWPCCSVTGAGADGPRGLTWGPGLQAAAGTPMMLGRAVKAGGALGAQQRLDVASHAWQ